MEKKVAKIRIQVLLETGELLVNEFNQESTVEKVLASSDSLGDRIRALVAEFTKPTQAAS